MSAGTETGEGSGVEAGIGLAMLAAQL
jgi:hypothetical protein